MAIFEAAEKVKIRRAILIGTSTDEITELDAKLDLLTDAEAAEVRADLTAFAKVKYGTTRSKGGIKGSDFSLERERQQITNELRRTLNYQLLLTYNDPDSLSVFGISFGSQSATDEYSH